MKFFVLVSLCLCLATAQEGDLTVFAPSCIRLGSSSDVSPSLIGPSYYLVGNGGIMTSFKTHVSQVAAAAAVDVVVLAASTGSTPTPECDAIFKFATTQINSCTTCTITVSSDANDTATAGLINASEIVYFAGGDQCKYVSWKNSLVYNAVINLVGRNGGVGGGSAGLAIEGEFVYDACTGSVTSSEALANPYDKYISFTYNFFLWPNLNNVLTDTHFYQRDRMGRLMAFLARQIQDGKTSAVYGLGIDENVAVVVDSTGRGKTYDNCCAYVVLADHVPETCKNGSRLDFSGYKIWKMLAGDSYDFVPKYRPTNPDYTVDVTRGILTPRDPY